MEHSRPYRRAGGPLMILVIGPRQRTHAQQLFTRGHAPVVMKDLVPWLAGDTAHGSIIDELTRRLVTRCDAVFCSTAAGTEADAIATLARWEGKPVYSHPGDVPVHAVYA